MSEFSPFHWLIVLFVAVCMFGMPFIAGCFLGPLVSSPALAQRHCENQ
jgi:hypothetical protein